MLYRKRPVVIEAFKYDGDLMDKFVRCVNRENVSINRLKKS